MNGVILDGKEIRDQILSELRPRVEALTRSKRPPALAVVLVGEDPASQIYVRGKIKACHDLGIRSIELTPPDSITTPELIDLVRPLTTDSSTDGILIQKPLPRHIDADALTALLPPSLDVDGFGAYNLGRLVLNEPAPRACTPAGIMELLHRYGIQVAGKNAVVVGRSDIVGKPMALLLLHANATVTICHSRTTDLAAHCRQADILVAAIGKAAALTADYIKPGAVVIDVGMNRIAEESEAQRLFASDPPRLASFAKNGTTLVGDVDPTAMRELSSAYTPVPGGVGPLTIAMLMANTVSLAEQHLS